MKKRKIRYAVVGLGHIAQTAVLPAFQNAAKNSELVALVSEDPLKLKKLSKKYGVENTFRYTEYTELLQSGLIDAVYISTPNVYHRDYAEMAARAGIHVLCEKPLATTEGDCIAMMNAANEGNVKLMTAYRLHFEAANLEAMKIARSKKLGDLRIFSSTFTMQVRDRKNIRLNRNLGGGTLYDIGIYCINASRYLFSDEPFEVFAMGASSNDSRFSEVDEMMAVTLRFPNERLAHFTISFGAADTSDYQLIGTQGKLSLESAYEYAEPMKLSVTIGEKTTHKTYPKRDQFAAELLYFSDCIQRNRMPEPSGQEGLIDLQIIQALQKSLESGKAVRVMPTHKYEHPRLPQKISRPGIRKPPRGVHTTAPSERS
jgi:predicted dehydrogenase